MADILMQVFQVGFFAALIRIATPLIVATIGELYAERSGVLNLGIEGTMLLGAMAGSPPPISPAACGSGLRRR